MSGTDGTSARFSHLSTTHSQLDSAYVRSPPDFLSVVFDLDPFAWAGSAAQQHGLDSLQRAAQDVCVFLSAHTALRHDNACAVYAAGRGRGSLLFSNAPSASQGGVTHSSRPDANTYQPFKTISDAVLTGLQANLLEAKDELSLPPSQGVVSALSQALCHINRLNLGISTNRAGDGDHKATNARAFQSRVLILTASPDSSSQYVSVMNCIFGAQKKGVLIDVCKLLGGKDSVFLQQASHLTGGTYFRLDGVAGLLQTLLTTFLASPSIRSQIRLPSNDDVDFRAACFCHGTVVDVGYVCSVCLSIFCEPPERCITCRAAFPKPTLARYQDEIKALKGTATSSATFPANVRIVYYQSKIEEDERERLAGALENLRGSGKGQTRPSKYCTSSCAPSEASFRSLRTRRFETSTVSALKAREAGSRKPPSPVQK